MKKIIALLLALVLVVAGSSIAFAAGSTLTADQQKIAEALEDYGVETPEAESIVGALTEADIQVIRDNKDDLEVAANAVKAAVEKTGATQVSVRDEIEKQLSKVQETLEKAHIAVDTTKLQVTVTTAGVTVAAPVTVNGTSTTPQVTTAEATSKPVDPREPMVKEMVEFGFPEYFAHSIIYHLNGYELVVAHEYKEQLWELAEGIKMVMTTPDPSKTPNDIIEVVNGLLDEKAYFLDELDLTVNFLDASADSNGGFFLNAIVGQGQAFQWVELSTAGFLGESTPEEPFDPAEFREAMAERLVQWLYPKDFASFIAENLDDDKIAIVNANKTQLVDLITSVYAAMTTPTPYKDRTPEDVAENINYVLGEHATLLEQLGITVSDLKVTTDPNCPQPVYFNNSGFGFLATATVSVGEESIKVPLSTARFLGQSTETKPEEPLDPAAFRETMINAMVEYGFSKDLASFIANQLDDDKIALVNANKQQLQTLAEQVKRIMTTPDPSKTPEDVVEVIEFVLRGNAKLLEQLGISVTDLTVTDDLDHEMSDQFSESGYGFLVSATVSVGGETMKTQFTTASLLGQAPAPSVTDETTDSPKTGDEFPVAATLCFVAAGGVLLAMAINKGRKVFANR